MTDLAPAAKLTAALLEVSPTGHAWLAAARAAPELPWATALKGTEMNEDRRIRLLEQLP